MSIRATFLLIATALVVLLGSILYVMTRLVENQQELAASETRHYESYKLADDEPCLLAAEEAIRQLGGEPLSAISNGGLDANWMTCRGIPTVSLGCGQENGHTTAERLDVEQFQQACRIAMRLATEAGQNA